MRLIFIEIIDVRWLIEGINVEIARNIWSVICVEVEIACQKIREERWRIEWRLQC